MTGWSADDIRVASLLEAEFPHVHVVDVIHHERQNMTESMPEGTWDNTDGDNEAEGVSFPEKPENPHESPLSVNFRTDGSPQVTIRARTVSEWRDLVNEVRQSGVLADVLACAQSFGGQAPAQGGWQTPQSGPPFGPNVSVPGAPGYQGPAQQAAPQWGAPQQQAPQGGGWNGGGQQQGQRKEYPAPQGWYRMNVPFPGGKDQLHALAQSQGIPKGNPNKGGAYNFFGLAPNGQPGKAWYCSPQAAQAFAQFSPVPA